MLEPDLLFHFSLDIKFRSRCECRPDTVDLPTPPLAEDTAMTFLTSFMGRFSGRPLCMRALKFGGVPDLGNPCCGSDQVNETSASIMTYQWVFMLQRPQT